MEYIVYVSTAKRLLSEKELIDLLKVSRARNKKYNVTGMLLYCQGTFMQVLEGDKNSLELIYKTIELDQRHKNIIKLAEGILKKRNFPEWSMAFASVNSETLQEIEGFLSSSINHTTDSADHITVTMLKTFADSNRLYISF
ncbi:BLUF domain-containing protein [Mucilaginibacter sabulilitoris]|uniref:BLUF domain-containing protein n=1 Tax=Mucilaginibacter sabulilitoris TaxID=1173583 RepID=A0ABZ0THF1_9SPHI|nr:BLUF domain-containing protein [Mucilaginibacter sabulilitoris]WPU92625.1 BLUF domain-containing protein [Mucilaginibacter sabulilitoris]